MELRANSELQGGKYRIIKTLGQGGFGITYLAEQTMMGRLVCIKEFFLKEYCDRDDQTSQVSLGTANNKDLMEKYQEKFLKEARLIARFDHPNVIRIHDVFSENNTAYYVMEYIDGENLNDVVKRRGAIPEAEALGYIRSVADGLAYVHRKGVNHLDVKPGNIMIHKEDGRPVLIDFGMSKQYDEAGEQTSSTPIGISEGYAPLEQYNLGGVSSFSPQTDIYSLAATLYRLITGQVPPKASDVMNEGLPEIPSSISSSTRIAICKAMQFRKKDRPATIGEFVSLLAEPSRTSDTLSEETKVIVPNRDTHPTVVQASAEETVLINNGTPAINKPQPSSSEKASESKPQIESEAEKYAKWKASQESVVPKGNKNRKFLLIIPAVVGVLLCAILLLTTGKKNEHQPPVSSSSYSSEERYLFKEGNKFGYFDEHGNTVIPCQYEGASYFSEGLVAVSVNGKWGFIDKAGELVIPCQYEGDSYFSEGLAAVRVNNQVGFIDKAGNLVIPCQYDSAFDFSEGLAAVNVNGKYGFIDKAGNIVIPCKYDGANRFSEGLAAVSVNFDWGFIDKAGDLVIPIKYDYAENFSEGLAAVSVNDKCGFIDKAGNIVIPCMYDYAYKFSEGLAAVSVNNQVGFIDKAGNLVIPCQYDLAFDFSEGLAAVSVNGKWGFIDNEGKMVIPCKYDSVGSFKNGRVGVYSDSDGSYDYALIDRSGLIIKTHDL